MGKVQNLTVDGKSYPCRVTMGSMVRFKRASGYDVSAMSETDVSDLVLFLWCCVVSACKADGIPFDMEFDDFADKLDPDTLIGAIKELDDEEKKSPQKA